MGMLLRPSSSMNGSVHPSVCPSVRPSVRPSVCLSVRLSHLFHYVPITVSSWNSQELLPMTKVRSMQKVKVRGRRSGSQVKNQLSCFQTVTPVWIHIWQWDDAQSLMLLRRGALLFFKVIFQISRSHGTTNRQFSPELSLSGLQLQFEFTEGYEMMHKAWSSIENVSYCFSMSSIKFQGHTGWKIDRLNPIWVRLLEEHPGIADQTSWVEY